MSTETEKALADFKPSIKFLRQVEAGQVRWVDTLGHRGGRLVGGEKTANAHYRAGLCSDPLASNTVRLTDAGRAFLFGGQAPDDSEPKLF